jgi:transcriptional regulator with PAS, ATPase and Fis domain
VEELSMMLNKIVERQQLITENLLLRKHLSERYKYENIIGKSAPMQKVFELIKTVADTNATVLVTGETGTGKEMVARAVHATSSRLYGPFIAISCGAIPETLLESELFGYEKGAYEATEPRKTGSKWPGDALFLDEIGDISMKPR